MNKLTKWMNMSYREWIEYRRYKTTFPKERIKQLDIPIYPGDFVQVMEGSEAGKSGKVLAVFRSLNWIYVRGLNLKVENFRDSNNTEKFLRQERPLLPSEVMLMEPTNKGVPTKVSIGVTPGGTRVRVSNNTGSVILYPREGDPYLVGAYSYRPSYTEGTYDTSPEDVLRKTYKPTLHTLEEEVALKYKDQIASVLRRTGWKDFAGRDPPRPVPKKPSNQFLSYLDVVKLTPKVEVRRGKKRAELSMTS